MSSIYFTFSLFLFLIYLLFLAACFFLLSIYLPSSLLSTTTTACFLWPSRRLAPLPSATSVAPHSASSDHYRALLHTFFFLRPRRTLPRRPSSASHWRQASSRGNAVARRRNQRRALCVSREGRERTRHQWTSSGSLAKMVSVLI